MKSLILTAQDARDLEKVGGLTITKPIKPTPRYIENASFRPAEGAPGDWYIIDGNRKRLGAESGVADIFAPPVQIGDVVFIREPWYRLRNPSGGESDRFVLASDSNVAEDQVAYKWSSPVSMPEAAARRFVRVVSVAPLYNESVAVWEIELEKITKEAALAAEADEPPIVSEADDPENVSDYLTYTGDMSPEDHERMIAKINADRARLSEVRERLARIDERLGEISRLMFEDREKVDANDRAAVEAENETLQEEQAQLSSEEAELVEALTAAGVPVDEIETPEEAQRPRRSQSRAPRPRRAPETRRRTTRRSALSRSESVSIAAGSGASRSREQRAAAIRHSARPTRRRLAFALARRP